MYSGVLILMKNEPPLPMNCIPLKKHPYIPPTPVLVQVGALVQVGSYRKEMNEGVLEVFFNREVEEDFFDCCVLVVQFRR